MVWLKIFIKFFTINKITKLKKENIFGFKIEAFDYDTIRFLFEEIFYKNEYFIKLDNRPPIIFDCGANIGMATIYFKWLYPDSIIYAFEPDKQTFKILKKNVLNNKLKNVHLFNVALGKKNGVITFFNDSNHPGSLLMSSKRARMLSNKITVKSLSLSSFVRSENIDSIDLVKMDIEGSETEVLCDLDKHNYLKNVERIVLEYHHNMCKQKTDLSMLLSLFEKNDFGYQIDAKCASANYKNKFQDVVLYCYKND